VADAHGRARQAWQRDRIPNIGKRAAAAAERVPPNANGRCCCRITHDHPRSPGPSRVLCGQLARFCVLVLLVPAQ